MVSSNHTINFYDIHAKAFASATYNIDLKTIYKPFLNALAHLDAANVNDIHILDLGCGSGRDAIYFANLGYRVTAIDASMQLIKWAKTHDSGNNIRWQCMRFDEINEQFKHYTGQMKFNAIWACASLLHVPLADLPNLLNQQLKMLSDNGVLYASFKYGTDERLENGRFFCDINEVRWQKIKAHVVFDVKQQIWITQDKRADSDMQWFNVLWEKQVNNQ